MADMLSFGAISFAAVQKMELLDKFESYITMMDLLSFSPRKLIILMMRLINRLLIN